MSDYTKIKHHDFRLGRYKIDWSEPDKSENAHALCSSPYVKNKTIQISPNLDDDKFLLQVLLDESIHASVWELDNDVVEEQPPQ